MTQTTVISLEQQLWCARRELRLRLQVYPNLVSNGRMLQKTADLEIASMRAIIATLKCLVEGRQEELFSREDT